jgi:hypothetical protein
MDDEGVRRLGETSACDTGKNTSELVGRDSATLATENHGVLDVCRGGREEVGGCGEGKDSASRDADVQGHNGKDYESTRKEEINKRRDGRINNTPYDNYRVFGIDGELMFRCSKSRVDWYMKRGLAEKLLGQENSYKLTFVAAGPGNRHDPYLIDDKENICVVCGAGTYLTRHHVVPYRYRKHFDLKYKEHNHYDVLVLCSDCHERYELHAWSLTSKLINSLTRPEYLSDKHVGNVSSLAKHIQGIERASARYAKTDPVEIERAMFEIKEALRLDSKEKLCKKHLSMIYKMPGLGSVRELAKSIILGTCVEDKKACLLEMLSSKVGHAVSSTELEALIQRLSLIHI